MPPRARLGAPVHAQRSCRAAAFRPRRLCRGSVRLGGRDSDEIMVLVFARVCSVLDMQGFNKSVH